MKRKLFPIILILSVFAPLQAQTDSLFAISSDTHIHWLSLVRENRQISFNAEIPPGNYSGITPIGNGLYAVVDDKMQDGFYVFSLKFNQRGELTSVYNVGFLESGNANRDAEGIVFVPSTKTIFTSGEKRNDVLEYGLDGKPTFRELKIPDVFKKAKLNRGLEALAYNANTHLFWTTTESPLKEDSILRLQRFGDDLQPRESFSYRLDDPDSAFVGNRVHGVSAMTALDDGSLLILEREALTTKEKLGSCVKCKIYQVNPRYSSDKHLVHEWKTTISLFHQDYANYEGMCLGPKLEDGSQVILLISDSQNRYSGFLSDWFKTLIVK